MAIVGVFPLFPVRNQRERFIRLRIPCFDNSLGAGRQFGELLPGENHKFYLQTVFALRQSAIQDTGPGMKFLLKFVQHGAQTFRWNNIHKSGITPAAGAAVHNETTIIQYWKP